MTTKTLTDGGVTSAPSETQDHVFHAGEELDGTSFRSRDIRGWDFSGASLRDADFRGVRSGRTRGQDLVVGGMALGASVILGAMTGFAGNWLQHAIESPNVVEKVVGVINASSLAVVMGFSLWRGIGYAVRYTGRRSFSWLSSPVLSQSLWVRAAGVVHSPRPHFSP